MRLNLIGSDSQNTCQGHHYDYSSLFPEALDDCDFAVTEAGCALSHGTDQTGGATLVVKNTFLNFSIPHEGEEATQLRRQRSASTPAHARLARGDVTPMAPEEVLAGPAVPSRDPAADEPVPAPPPARAGVPEDGQGSGRPVAAALARILEQLAFGGCGAPHGATCFHTAQPPEAGIHDYLQQLVASPTCSDRCLIVSLLYIDRLCQRNPAFTVSPLNLHRLATASLTLAAKLLEGAGDPEMCCFAKAAGISVQELTDLQDHFLRLIKRKVSVKMEEYTLYQEIVMTAARRGAVAAAPRRVRSQGVQEFAGPWQ